MALPTSENEVTVRKLSSTLQGLATKISTKFGTKADKVSNATSGNFAGLDANGNLTDSGNKASDFATSAQGGKADSAIQSVKVSGTALTPDSNKAVNIPLASSSANGAMSKTDKSKLDGIASGAQVNVIETIKRNGTALTPDENKAVDISVPTPSSTATDIKMDGTQSAGSSTNYARADHVHPTDTSREKAANRETSSLTTNSTSKYPSSKVVADFVNSSIATNTANFLGTYDVVTDLGLTTSATNAQIATALGSHTWPTGVTPTNNDYVFVSVDDSSTITPAVADEYRRFKYNGTEWAYEYTLNNSSFTAAQWAAINSGLASADKTAYDAHISNTSNPHGVTKDQVGLGNVGNFKAVSTVASQGLSSTEKSNARTNIGAGTYSKPSGGIPKTDLASAVQASLDLADSAVQDVSGKLDKDGDGKAVTVSFTQASSRSNVETGDSLATLFGKIKKWFADLGTAATKNVASSGDASSTQVVMGSDSRLSDSRTPTSHASSSTTYGAGTTSKYGHVKIVEGDMNGKSTTSGEAAATNHTHSQYQTLLTEMTDAEVNAIIDEISF